MWIKKCVKIREMLFKNQKLLFGNTHQTPAKLHNFLFSPFIVLQIMLFVKTLSKEQKLLPPKRKKEKKKNKVC